MKGGDKVVDSQHLTDIELLDVALTGNSFTAPWKYMWFRRHLRTCKLCDDKFRLLSSLGGRIPKDLNDDASWSKLWEEVDEILLPQPARSRGY